MEKVNNNKQVKLTESKPDGEITKLLVGNVTDY